MRLPAYTPRLCAIVRLPVGANHDPGIEFAPDSLLEEAVSSEPVSEVEEPGTREGCQFR